MASAARALDIQTAPDPMPIGALFSPPGGLLQRVRWLFLAAMTLVLVGVGLQGVLAAQAAGTAWPVALAAPIALYAVWIHGYLRRGYTLGHDAAAVALLVLLASVQPVPQVVAWLIIATAWLRVLHASGRAALAVIAAYTAVTAGTALIGPAPAGLATSISRMVLLGIGAGVMYLIGASLGGYERSIARERRLREAGRALVAAGDRASIYAAAIEGARALLAETRGASVELAVGSEERLEVVAEAGGGTGAPGGRVDLAGLPADVRAALARGEAVEIAHADEALWRAFDLDARRGVLYALPLAGQGTLDGALVIGSDRPLDAELKDDLETLAGLAALAVESQLLREGHAEGEAPASAERPATAASTASWWSFPRELPERVRWLFLAGAWLATLATAATLWAQPEATPSWAAAATAPLWLGGWWLYGHRRGSYPLVGDLAVALLLGLTMTVPGDPAGTVVYLAMWCRAVHGSARGVAIAFALYAVALVGAEIVAPTGDTPLELVVQIAELAAIAGLVHWVCATLRRSERAMARERALRDASRALVAATRLDAVERAVVEGARRLLADTPGASAELALGAGTPDPGVRRGGLYAVPLQVRDQLEGALIVASEAPLDDELKDDLETLSDLAALAVEGVGLRRA
jgi:hypothetical protein